VNVALRVALSGLLLSAVSACGKVEAHTPQPPALQVPAPPPRVVVPVKLEPAPTEIPAPQPTAPPPPAPATSPRPRETPPPAAPAPAKPAEKPAPLPAGETPVLQTTSNVAELEKRARTLLDEAKRDLALVVRANLSADAKAQYDQAQRFCAQAQEALKNKNFVYARDLAEKAANLASQLPKRLTTSPSAS
jgi:outer membrane biosynthesis protein TonB